MRLHEAGLRGMIQAMRSKFSLNVIVWYFGAAYVLVGLLGALIGAPDRPSVVIGVIASAAGIFLITLAEHTARRF